MNAKPRVRKAALMAVGLVLAALAAALVARPITDATYEAHAQWPHATRSVADLFPPGR
ncbi:MAG TPA: hypothetical protein VMN56_16985 [Casimicrobiaceae bacterium]|nr:hypothetical protein [Casimicrobiaceae bacterium]